MFISEDEADKRKRSLEVVTKQRAGRGIGNDEIPDFLRPIIGTAAKLSTSRAAAQEFGVAHATAANYANGKVSQRADGDLQAQIDSRIQTVQDVALTKMMVALNLLDEDMMQNKTGVNVSNIAANMGRIVEKTTKKVEQINQGTQVIIYAPQVRSEEKYEVIEG